MKYWSHSLIVHPSEALEVCLMTEQQKFPAVTELYRMDVVYLTSSARARLQRGS